MGWCLYGLIYVITIVFVVVCFISWAMLNVFLSLKIKFKTIIALHFISLIVILLGYLVTESFINSQSQYICKEKEFVAVVVMIISVVSILIICIIFSKYQFLINKKITTTLAILDVGIVTIFIFFVLIPNWLDYKGLFEFFFFLPAEVIRVIFTGKH